MGSRARWRAAIFFGGMALIVSAAGLIRLTHKAPSASAQPLADVGRAIVDATRDSLPGFVGNKLRCTSCHLDGGLRQDAIPWTGVYTRFPQYRPRSGRVIS